MKKAMKSKSDVPSSLPQAAATLLSAKASVATNIIAPIKAAAASTTVPQVAPKVNIVSAKPVLVKAAVTMPAATKPAVAKPVINKPFVAKPIVTKPVLVQASTIPAVISQSKPIISRVMPARQSTNLGNSMTPQMMMMLPPKMVQRINGVPQIADNKMQTESEINPKAHLIEASGAAKKAYDLEKGLTLEVKTLQKCFQLTGEEMTLPIMVSVRTLDSTDDKLEQTEQMENAKDIGTEDISRSPLDLICVVDNSGSMQGEKISNLKTTLLQLLDMLGVDDRISIIEFNSYAKAHCNLRRTDTANKAQIQSIINSIEADGGTDIFSGMRLAIDMLAARKQKNPVSSIFLLSDGQDQDALRKIQLYLTQQKEPQQFTIHSFGFGSDHDAPLMNSICDLRDGNFYFIEKINQVDEFFVDALGGLFSVIAQEIEITIELNVKDNNYMKFFQPALVSKTYGDMWKVVQQNYTYKISINQLISGVSKDFMFEVFMPAYKAVETIGDSERNVELVKARLTAIPIDIVSATKIAKDASLMLTLFSKDEPIAQDSEINEVVEFNYLRVKAASAMEMAIDFSEKQQFDQGQLVLDKFIYTMEKAHPKNKEKLKIIMKDVMDCKQSAQPQVYQHEGKIQMLSKKAANFKQSSQATGEDDLFANKMQKKMVMKQKMSKN